MHFVSISKLKGELAEDSWNGGFPYFIAYFALDASLVATWGMYSFDGSPTTLEGIEAGLYFAVLVGGTIAAYYSNGGSAGKAFLDRYFALAWVLGIRFFLFLLPVFLVFISWIWTDESYPDQTAWPEVTAYILIIIVYYWRINVHIRAVSEGRPNHQLQRTSEDASR